jgi:hypothetical protein
MVAQTFVVDWTWIFGLAQSLGAAGTVITVYFVYRQSKQTQQQMDSRLRAWVGNVSSKQQPSLALEFGNVTIYLKNYGEIPASLCVTRGIIVKIVQNYKNIEFRIQAAINYRDSQSKKLGLIKHDKLVIL